MTMMLSSSDWFLQEALKTRSGTQKHPHTLEDECRKATLIWFRNVQLMSVVPDLEGPHMNTGRESFCDSPVILHLQSKPRDIQKTRTMEK